MICLAVRLLRRLPALAAVLLTCSLPASGQEAATFTTRESSFRVNAQGSLSAITRRSDGRNYLAPDQPAPLLSLRIAGKWLSPTNCVWDAGSGRLTLRYPAENARAVVAATAKPTHVVFETVEVEPAQDVELVLWGSYPIAIRETVGEVIGVVRDREFAVGIQALNLKTLGGYPHRESDIEADLGVDDPGHYPGLPEELKQGQHFRGDTARLTEFGSVIQAYCRNRSRERVIANWGHEQFVAPPYADGGVVGSKIALFACPTPQALDTIGAIEVAEGLPHPMLDGVWAKQAPGATASYLIVDFSEATIDRAIEMTRRAGLTHLYHSSPFETWGHFELKQALFPNGWDGLKECVEKARKAGVQVGFHTLSNFITPNDPYVTPKPDPRLARVGTSALTATVDATQTEIPVAAPDFFRKKTALNAVVIGEELVRYESVSTNAPWRLLRCQRGAWGTTAATHAAGTSVGRLMDHDYKVFLTDADLTQEVARNLARLCNHTGIRQISLDGLEGAWSTGMGQYGRTLFAQTWYDALEAGIARHHQRRQQPRPLQLAFLHPHELGRAVVCGISRKPDPLPLQEPVALRPQPDPAHARLVRAPARHQPRGRRMAARAGGRIRRRLRPGRQPGQHGPIGGGPGFDRSRRQFGAMPAILEAIRQWETARHSGAFPPEVKARLCDNHREFQLKAAGDHQWDLFELQTARFTSATNQTETTVTFTNRHAAQPLRWTLRSTGQERLNCVSLAINGQLVVSLGEPGLPPDGSLTYRGGTDAVIGDAAWKELGRVPVNAASARIAAGEGSLTFGGSPQAVAQLKLEVHTVDAGQRLRASAERDGRGDGRTRASQRLLVEGQKVLSGN